VAHWRAPPHLGRQSVQRRSDDGQLLGPPDIANKDAIVFTLGDGRVALIHRIQPDMQLAVFDDLDHLWNAGPDYWDNTWPIWMRTPLFASRGALGIGAGAPPIDTEAGFLLFFHERAPTAPTPSTWPAGSHDRTATQPSSQPLLVPELEWERRGDVDNVVFVQGAHSDGDVVYLTYGAADRCIGVATAKISHLLDALHAAA